MTKHLKPRLKRFHAIEVTRIAIGNRKLVYVLIADKKYRYGLHPVPQTTS